MLENCFISINTSCSTEPLLVCGEQQKLAGVTIQTVTLTGYAGDKIHAYANATAGVSIPLVRKYDCDTDEIIFLCEGKGASYENGDTQGLVSIGTPSITSTAWSLSVLDPASLCRGKVAITSGHGLSYNGNPISFETVEDECTMLTSDWFDGQLYLQSFNLNMPSGQVPTASYTLLGVVDSGEFKP